jgi:hypothetical protein
MRFTWIFALIGDWLIALFHPKLPKREQLELSDYDSIDSRYCEVRSYPLAGTHPLQK